MPKFIITEEYEGRYREADNEKDAAEKVRELFDELTYMGVYEPHVYVRLYEIGTDWSGILRAVSKSINPNLKPVNQRVHKEV
jgi:hypothetical protein